MVYKAYDFTTYPMATSRFYIPEPLAPNTTIALPVALAHHALRVLRLPAGAPIVLFDGRGGQYPARLLIDGKRGYAELGAHDPVEAELPGRITLAQGIAASDKMDWVIEKAVELGAACVAPIAAQRSVLQLSGERLQKRLAHWQRIAQAASEQSGRNRIMEVLAPQTLAGWLEARPDAATSMLFCHPGSAQTLEQALSTAGNELTLLVGPEGGWSEAELALVERHGLTGVRFGQRVLRTETAGLALIAAVSALRGWQ